MQLLELHKNDVSNLSAWLQKSQNQFTSKIMATDILTKLAHSLIITGKLFSSMVNDTTDVSNARTTCVLYLVC